MSRRGRGLAHALLAYVGWGVLPVYWKALASVDSRQILAMRILGCALFVCTLLALRGKTNLRSLLAGPRRLASVVACAVLIAVNWGLYIWSVNGGHIVAASLGYYLNPIVNIALGLAFLRERLSVFQLLALGLALIGVALKAFLSGGLPWISLALALSFGLYGFIKKRAGMDANESLAAETIVLGPIALAYLAYELYQGRGFLHSGPLVLSLLAMAGLVTYLPLYFFAKAVGQLPLSTMGFVQFVSPSLQLLMGICLFGERVSWTDSVAFAFVGAALALYMLSLFLGPKARGAMAKSP